MGVARNPRHHALPPPNIRQPLAVDSYLRLAFWQHGGSYFVRGQMAPKCRNRCLTPEGAATARGANLRSVGERAKPRRRRLADRAGGHRRDETPFSSARRCHVARAEEVAREDE